MNNLTLWWVMMELMKMKGVRIEKLRDVFK